jgi:putative oxidoreductase
MKKYIFLIATFILAFQFIIFGANKLHQFISPEPPTDATALSFLGAMFTTYLAKFVGVIEIIGAIFLVIPRTRFLGVLLLLPIMANIVVFHLAHDNPGNGIWLIVTAIYAVVVYSKKDQFKSLINIQ